MKRSILYLLILSLFLCFSSCSSEDDTYRVRVEIDTNSTSLVRVYGVQERGAAGMLFKGNFVDTIEVDKFTNTNILVRCDDPDTMIRLRVWVNGKLACDLFGTQYLDAGQYLPSE